MNDPNIASVGEWVRTLAAAASPVLVVFGWWWVNRQNNGREQRKELRQLIDRSLKLVTEVVDLGTRYHASTESDTHTPHLGAWKLTLGLSQVAGHIKLLSDRGLKVHATHEPYIQLKRALTGAEFQTSAEKPWTADDPRWMDVMHATNALTNSLDSVFFTTFSE